MPAGTMLLPLLQLLLLQSTVRPPSHRHHVASSCWPLLPSLLLSLQ
jgi:hypothetical protein